MPTRLLSTSLSVLIALPFAGSSAATLRERCSWSGSPASPTFQDVRMSPVVLDLDGDTVPEVAFLADDGGFDGARLIIVSGRDCTTLRDVGAPGCVPCTGDATCRDLDVRADGAFLHPEGLAAGDLDGDGLPELVAINEAGDRIVAFGSDGSFKWCSESVPRFGPGWPTALGAHSPAVADLDGDGRAEVVVGTAIFDAEGHLMSVSAEYSLQQVPSVPIDVDGDGDQELAAGPVLLEGNGALRWDRRDTDEGWWGPAPADLDADGVAEIVITGERPARLSVLDARTGATRATLHLPPEDMGCFAGVGSVAIGEVDGDPPAEIAVASGTAACLIDWEPPDSLMTRWCRPIRDCTGGWVHPALADVDHDGLAEVLLRDQQDFWMFDSDGTALLRVPRSGGTYWESVVVADADGDCAGEVLLAADAAVAGGPDRGLTIFEGASRPLPAARPAWNEASYRGTNIGDSGFVPAAPDLPTGFRMQMPPAPPEPRLVVSARQLWPPNHRMQRLEIGDAGGLPVRITSVRQDEPVDESGDGRHSPDARLDGESLLLRAERSGGGDGRTYHVGVAVGRSGCEVLRVVTICVPHDRRRESECVDQGPLYDSLSP